MAAVLQRPAARRDLGEHYVSWRKLADRFLANVEASFTGLSEHPEMGEPFTPCRPELAGLRKWPVKDFEKVLIFTSRVPHRVSIVRVHIPQDWWSVLGIDA